MYKILYVFFIYISLHISFHHTKKISKPSKYRHLTKNWLLHSFSYTRALFCLTNHFLWARLNYKISTCIELSVRCEARPRAEGKKCPAHYLIVVSRNLILSEMHCTKRREPRLTANLNSGECCIVWYHTKDSEWKLTTAVRLNTLRLYIKAMTGVYTWIAITQYINTRTWRQSRYPKRWASNSKLRDWKTWNV